MGELYKNGRTDRDDFWGMTTVGPINHIFAGDPDPPRKEALFRGSALCSVLTMHECIAIVRLPPRANVPAQRTRRTNAFAVVRSDRTAMRPFAKLL